MATTTKDSKIIESFINDVRAAIAVDPEKDFGGFDASSYSMELVKKHWRKIKKTMKSDFINVGSNFDGKVYWEKLPFYKYLLAIKNDERQEGIMEIPDEDQEVLSTGSPCGNYSPIDFIGETLNIDIDLKYDGIKYSIIFNKNEPY